MPPVNVNESDVVSAVAVPLSVEIVDQALPPIVDARVHSTLFVVSLKNNT